MAAGLRFKGFATTTSFRNENEHPIATLLALFLVLAVTIAFRFSNTFTAVSTTQNWTRRRRRRRRSCYKGHDVPTDIALQRALFSFEPSRVFVFVPFGRFEFRSGRAPPPPCVAGPCSAPPPPQIDEIRYRRDWTYSVRFGERRVPFPELHRSCVRTHAVSFAFRETTRRFERYERERRAELFVIFAAAIIRRATAGHYSITCAARTFAEADPTKRAGGGGFSVNIPRSCSGVDGPR